MIHNHNLATVKPLLASRLRYKANLPYLTCVDLETNQYPRTNGVKAEDIDMDDPCTIWAMTLDALSRCYLRLGYFR